MTNRKLPHGGIVTATEVLHRQRIWGRRAALELAINGTPSMCLSYCIGRAFEDKYFDLVAYGQSMTHSDEMIERAPQIMRNFARLQRFKKQKEKTK